MVPKYCPGCWIRSSSDFPHNDLLLWSNVQNYVLAWNTNLWQLRTRINAHRSSIHRGDVISPVARHFQEAKPLLRFCGSLGSATHSFCSLPFPALLQFLITVICILARMWLINQQRWWSAPAGWSLHLVRYLPLYLSISVWWNTHVSSTDDSHGVKHLLLF